MRSLDIQESSPPTAAANRAHDAAPDAPDRGQFIPLRASELIDVLARSLQVAPAEAEDFRRVCRWLQANLHAEYGRTLSELKDAYAPFDPDAETHAISDHPGAALDERQEALFQGVAWLLARGNFVRLAQEEIERALADRSHWGLNLAIDFGIFERLEIYGRGDTTIPRTRRSAWHRFRQVVVDVPVYRRLVVLFRLRAADKLPHDVEATCIHLKMFKDVPKMDLEMLLPGTQVKMSLFDRCKIVLPTLSGLSIALWKLAQGALVFTAAGIYGVLAYMGMLGGTVGYGVRSVYGYLNTKQRYQLNLTRSLYYQNLDNNAGVVFRLLDEAEEQDNREAILAYFHLWRSEPQKGWSAETLDQHVEAFLATQNAGHVDFEVDDALNTLGRLELIESCPNGKFRAIAIGAALEVLERRWREMPDRTARGLPEGGPLPTLARRSA